MNILTIKLLLLFPCLLQAQTVTRFDSVSVMNLTPAGANTVIGIPRQQLVCLDDGSLVAYFSGRGGNTGDTLFKVRNRNITAKLPIFHDYEGAHVHLAVLGDTVYYPATTGSTNIRFIRVNANNMTVMSDLSLAMTYTGTIPSVQSGGFPGRLVMMERTPSQISDWRTSSDGGRSWGTWRGMIDNLGGNSRVGLVSVKDSCMALLYDSSVLHIWHYRPSNNTWIQEGGNNFNFMSIMGDRAFTATLARDTVFTAYQSYDGTQIVTTKRAVGRGPLTTSAVWTGSRFIYGDWPGYVALTRVDSTDIPVLFYVRTSSGTNIDSLRLYMRYWVNGAWSTEQRISPAGGHGSINLTCPFVVPKSHGFKAYCLYDDALGGHIATAYFSIGDTISNPPPPGIVQLIAKNSSSNSVTIVDDLSNGTVPYDSVVLHWSTTRANVQNLLARDIILSSAGDPSTFSKTGLASSTKYYFRILAYDSGVRGDTTAIDSVMTAVPPPGRITQAITKSATNNTATVIDDLTGGSAPYDSLILYWSITRANVSNLSARDIKVTGAGDPYTFSKTSLAQNTKYYFRVAAFDIGVTGDTSTIDSVTTSTTGLILLSVGVPVTVCGSYPGYTAMPINNGIINPRGANTTTWASDVSSSTPHWIIMTFSSAKVVQRAKIYWAWNNSNSSWMCSRQYIIQYWNSSTGTFQNAITVNNNSSDSITSTDFTPVTTTQIRYWQPANMGPINSAALAWLTELQLYGTELPSYLSIGNSSEQPNAGEIPSPSSIDNLGSIPEVYSLGQSYPNPFNAQATIEYALPMASLVSLIIYDMEGRKVEILINEYQEAGYHAIVWNAAHTPSSMYFYRLVAGDYSESKRMLLVK